MLTSSANTSLIISHISDTMASMGILTDTELRTALFVLTRLIGDKDSATLSSVNEAYSNSQNPIIDRISIYNSLDSAYASAVKAHI